MKIKYQIFNPSGNITALVIGDEYNTKERRIINNSIMNRNSKVEQVGFISIKDKKLTMAGGEFCGNATRCAAQYYINKEETKYIKINGKKVSVGIDKYGDVWCEMPIERYKIIKISNDYIVKFKGITIVVVNNKRCVNNDLIKEAKDIIKLYNIKDKAVGVMFTENKNNIFKIFPVVWVKKIDTLFLENACGSGSIVVTTIKSLVTNKSGEYIVCQPSGDILKTNITIKKNKAIKAILKGKILIDNQIYEIEI